MSEFLLNQPADLWVVTVPESNPWTPLIDWRLGFWHSRTAFSSLNGLKWNPEKPLLMATPAGLASPRVLFWPQHLDSQSDFDRVVQVVAKLKMRSAVFLVGEAKPSAVVETWMHRAQGQGLDLKVCAL